MGSGITPPPVSLEALRAIFVQGDGTVSHLVALTQAEYDALDPPDATTLYLIVEEQ